MNGSLPEGSVFYKRTPDFTETTVPAGLLNDHSTKSGTWGVIRVEEGELRFVVTDPRRTASSTIVTAANPVVIEPTIVHRVEPLGKVLFHVDFHRLPDAADSSESQS